MTCNVPTANLTDTHTEKCKLEAMKAELVLIPCAARGHLTALLEFSRLLVARSNKLLITVLLIKIPNDPNLSEYADSLAASFESDRIKFVDITSEDATVSAEINPVLLMEQLFQRHKSRVKSAVVSADGSPRAGLAGFVLDMACLTLSDVAGELGVPTYAFWPASAGFLGVALNLIISSLDPNSNDYSFPSFANPVPGRVVPSGLFNSSVAAFLRAAKAIKESNGVVVNSSAEIEPNALKALTSPAVYAVGPVLSLPERRSGDKSGEVFSGGRSSEVLEWLDGQPTASVLFLCFGSIGCFRVDQVKEIAVAIESVGVRFLWTLRQQPPEGNLAWASHTCTDLGSILPGRFLERTAERGRVIGWAPQTAVLAHPAVGGFVSHCGWNSILESLWFGVPIATWPLYAEQQLNAFEMVVELGLAVEVKMDYRFGFNEDDDGAALVSAEVIEEAIGKVMDGESEIRKRVKEMSVKCRNAVVNGGSSSSLDSFVSRVLESLNI